METVFTFYKRARVIASIGGKLNGYRKTASKVMKLLGPALPRRKHVARTHRIKLSPQDRL